MEVTDVGDAVPPVTVTGAKAVTGTVTGAAVTGTVTGAAVLAEEAEEAEEAEGVAVLVVVRFEKAWRKREEMKSSVSVS